MKYILIVGKSNTGKSTTIDAVCKKINPTSVKRLIKRKELEEIDPVTPLHDGTFIAEIHGKTILVVAESPTEQNIKITALMAICAKLNLNIDVAIVAKRLVERRFDFNTRKELMVFGKCVLEERVKLINDKNFKETKEWQGRINKIHKIVKKTLRLKTSNQQVK